MPRIFAIIIIIIIIIVIIVTKYVSTKPALWLNEIAMYNFLYSYKIRLLIITISTIITGLTMKVSSCTFCTKIFNFSGLVCFHHHISYMIFRRSEYTRVLFLHKQVSFRPIRLQQALHITWFTVEGQVVERSIDVIRSS